MAAPITFTYVEDYIEFIGGYRDITNKSLGLFEQVPSPLSLARYDKSIIESLASQTAELKNPYTDKQAALAQKLVNTYRKQLSKLLIPVEVPESLDRFRLGIRQMDRSKRMTLVSNDIAVKFPFDPSLIELIKVQQKKGQGSVEFSSTSKTWRLALTESNLNWAITVGEQYEFEMDPQLTALYEQMLEVEASGFAIELIVTDTGFDITNCSDSLRAYVLNNGGFGLDNQVWLIDNAPVLGYSLGSSVLENLHNYVPDSLLGYTLARRQSFKGRTLNQVMEYARAVNRLPVYVYNPQVSSLSAPDTEEIKYLVRSKIELVDTKMPLLVSSTSVLIGPRKEAWINNAEKMFILE